MVEHGSAPRVGWVVRGDEPWAGPSSGRGRPLAAVDRLAQTRPVSPKPGPATMAAAHAGRRQLSFHIVFDIVTSSLLRWCTVSFLLVQSADRANEIRRDGVRVPRVATYSRRRNDDEAGEPVEGRGRAARDPRDDVDPLDLPEEEQLVYDLSSGPSTSTPRWPRRWPRPASATAWLGTDLVIHERHEDTRRRAAGRHRAPARAAGDEDDDAGRAREAGSEIEYDLSEWDGAGAGACSPAGSSKPTCPSAGRAGCWWRPRRTRAGGRRARRRRGELVAGGGHARRARGAGGEPVLGAVRRRRRSGQPSQRPRRHPAAERAVRAGPRPARSPSASSPSCLGAASWTRCRTCSTSRWSPRTSARSRPRRSRFARCCVPLV